MKTHNANWGLVPESTQHGVAVADKYIDFKRVSHVMACLLHTPLGLRKVAYISVPKQQAMWLSQCSGEDQVLLDGNSISYQGEAFGHLRLPQGLAMHRQFKNQTPYYIGFDAPVLVPYIEHPVRQQMESWFQKARQLGRKLIDDSIEAEERGIYSNEH